MVIAERYGIILKSETAGNSEDRPHNSSTVFFEYISLPNIRAVLVFQPRVLADGGRIDLVLLGNFGKVFPTVPAAVIIIKHVVREYVTNPATVS